MTNNHASSAPDVRACDTSLPSATQTVISYPSTLLTQLFTIVALVPFFSMTSFVIAGLAAIVAQLYLDAQRGVKREQSNRFVPTSFLFPSPLSFATS